MNDDTELMDFLEELNRDARYTGMCILRDSTTGRGWRLHETKSGAFGKAYPTVREAIRAYMAKE